LIWASRGVGDVVQHRAADDRPVLTDVVAAERERGDDAEVPASAAQGPEQVAVGRLAGRDEGSIREDHVGGEEVVDREAEAPGEVPDR
jgi:hypothetical protein